MNKSRTKNKSNFLEKIDIISLILAIFAIMLTIYFYYNPYSKPSHVLLTIKPQIARGYPNGTDDYSLFLTINNSGTDCGYVQVHLWGAADTITNVTRLPLSIQPDTYTYGNWVNNNFGLIFSIAHNQTIGNIVLMANGTSKYVDLIDTPTIGTNKTKFGSDYINYAFNLSDENPQIIKLKCVSSA